MFFHVNTQKGCVVLTNSSVKHSYAPQDKMSTYSKIAINMVICYLGIIFTCSSFLFFSSIFIDVFNKVALLLLLLLLLLLYFA